MEDEFGLSICGRPNGARGIEAAHVLPKTDGTSGGEGDSGYGQYGRSSRWVTAKSVGGCRVFFYAWDAFEEVEDYGTRSVSSSRRGDYIHYVVLPQCIAYMDVDAVYPHFVHISHSLNYSSRTISYDHSSVRVRNIDDIPIFDLSYERLIFLRNCWRRNQLIKKGSG